jgi:hypothetical protein
MFFYPAFLAVELVVAIIRVVAQPGTAPSLPPLVLTGFARTVLLIGILATPLEPAATTLAAAAHWNLLDHASFRMFQYIAK